VGVLISLLLTQFRNVLVKHRSLRLYFMSKSGILE
jgi:hypothetical protein